MAFQIKDFVSIVASMINHMKGTQQKITDFNVGSVARTLVEAPAIEIDQLYTEMFHGLQEAIPVATYQTFDFTKLPAEAARGVLQFGADDPAATNVTIPAGTSARVPGGSILYVTTETVVLAVGETTVLAPASANSTGAAGNTAASTVTQLVSSISGIDSVTNPATIIGGREEETDAERKERFRSYISTLPRGIVAAIEYGAKLGTVEDEFGNVIESVREVLVYEPHDDDPMEPVGLIHVYVYNGSGGTTAGLVDRVHEILYGYTDANGKKVPGWKAAGTVAEVYEANEISTGVTAEIEVLDGYDAAEVITRCETAVSDYIQALPIGATVILAEIIAIIMSVDGVYNVSVSLPAADVVMAAKGDKAVPGTIAITEAP